MTTRTTDTIVRVCFWVSLALAIGALLNGIRTGHLMTGIFLTGTLTAGSAILYFRNGA